MLIHLYDCDQNGFPNLVLLKLSAWHKAKGDDVINNFPLIRADKNYYGSVFTWSQKPPPGEYIGPSMDLPEHIEHICPDYTGMDYSIGFLSRGCPNKCWFCIVPNKEGDIRPHSEPQEFIRHKYARFLDNNWLASPRFAHDCDWLFHNGIRCDFNQGLDSRLVDNITAKFLTRLLWWKPIRFACDSHKQKEPLRKAVKLLRNHGYCGVPFIYILVTDIEDALDRVEFCRDLGLDPFAQPYRDDYGLIDDEARHFARWVNHKAIFKSVKWENYKK